MDAEKFNGLTDDRFRIVHQWCDVCGVPEPSRGEIDALLTALDMREAAMPATPNDMIQVTREDGNNYCRILKALGMEEEGDPVAEVKRLVALSAQPATMSVAPVAYGVTPYKALFDDSITSVLIVGQDDDEIEDHEPGQLVPLYAAAPAVDAEQDKDVARDAARYRWLCANMTFHESDGQPPVLASVSKRIWYHATDSEAYPFDDVVDAAMSQSVKEAK